MNIDLSMLGAFAIENNSVCLIVRLIQAGFPANQDVLLRFSGSVKTSLETYSLTATQ